MIIGNHMEAAELIMSMRWMHQDERILALLEFLLHDNERLEGLLSQKADAHHQHPDPLGLATFK